MKKFFLVLITILIVILIAGGCAHFFQDAIPAFTMNGILIAFVYLIFNRLWKKISEEESFKKLGKITTTMLTVREQERQMLIEKQSLTWQDIAIIANNALYWPDLRDIFKEKELPALINLITISDLKKQIIWSSNFVTALENLNAIAERAYDDEILKMLTKILHDVEPFIEEKEGYVGADKLLQLIEMKANILCNFLI